MADWNQLRKDKPYLFFLSSAVLLTIIISVLVGTVFWMAYPVISRVGIPEFIFGTKWSQDGTYGIWVFICGTFAMTATTMAMAIPLGLFTAIYLSEFAHPKLRSVMRSSIELLVGIPSVVYGIFGLFILKSLVRDHINPIVNSTIGFIPIFSVPKNSDGTGVFLASIVLAVMVIPTIISLAEDAMRSVSKEHREGSFALGATKWETIHKIVLPTATPGIMAGITLGMTRAVGETMAIVMLMGNAYRIPTSIFDTGYAMTSKILTDISHNLENPEIVSALFGIAAALFVIEAIFIGIMRIISGGVKHA